MSKNVIFQQDYSYARLIVWVVIEVLSIQPKTKRLGACVHAQGGYFEHCSIASVYFTTQHNRYFSEPPTFFEENNVVSNLWTTLFFRKVLRNVFLGEVGKLTIY